MWHPVCSSRVTSCDQSSTFLSICVSVSIDIKCKKKRKETQECLKSEINKYLSPLHSSRFPLAVCGLPELSCWPVSRGGRISHRSVWPAHPKASMFRRRRLLHRCCCCHRCSRAATKVSSCHTRKTDIKAGSAGAPRALTLSSKSRSDVRQVVFSSAQRLQLIKNNGPPDDDDVC